MKNTNVFEGVINSINNDGCRVYVYALRRVLTASHDNGPMFIEAGAESPVFTTKRLEDEKHAPHKGGKVTMVIQNDQVTIWGHAHFWNSVAKRIGAQKHQAKGGQDQKTAVQPQKPEPQQTAPRQVVLGPSCEPVYVVVRKNYCNGHLQAGNSEETIFEGTLRQMINFSPKGGEYESVTDKLAPVYRVAMGESIKCMATHSFFLKQGEALIPWYDPRPVPQGINLYRVINVRGGKMKVVFQGLREEIMERFVRGRKEDALAAAEYTSDDGVIVFEVLEHSVNERYQAFPGGNHYWVSHTALWKETGDPRKPKKPAVKAKPASTAKTTGSPQTTPTGKSVAPAKKAKPQQIVATSFDDLSQKLGEKAAEEQAGASTEADTKTTEMTASVPEAVAA